MCDNLIGVECMAIFVKMLRWQTELIVGLCYKCPCCPQPEQINLFNLFKEVQNRSVLIMGDFNIPYIN